ncbi:hypothetical protein [Aequorivita antarctica]|uniref:Uncharacterized protein n=1 Tax=Aequorivita antarctica TaxID=153266 RepID=A0A5C6YUN9_9FLAO|nr:hypothetical protein [Aequorivita antarctica]TXD71243.1 hypothetical protein ESU54_17530 [Aequorivita antarctica]SRX76399.1 hypothetical protein AEQU3_03399 [Aequorivita antarctica]
MEFISDKDEKYVLISKQSDLDELIDRFTQRELFAYQFRFSERDYFIGLLEALKINYEDFTEKYFHFDSLRKLHISESEFGYVWISTYGLVAKNRATTNRAVNSCVNQYTVVKLLLEKAIATVQNEKVYDVDSYGFGYLSTLSPALFHNLIFYVEVFCKAYLSLTGVEAKHTHKLSLIYQKTVETMISKNHNNSMFQALILDQLYKLVAHVGSIPGDFREQFIKYDDNPLDDTTIIFQPDDLIGMMNVIEISNDFINDYFYIGTKTYFLESGFYKKLLGKAMTEEKKKKIKDMYSHLANGKK